LINYVLIVNEIILIIFVNSGTLHSFWSLVLIKKKCDVITFFLMKTKDEGLHFRQHFDAAMEKF
jgi:hypothetical protein